MERLKSMPLIFRIGYILILILAVIGLVYSMINRSVPVSDNPNQQLIYGDGWGITGIRSIRTSHITHVKATDRHVFFAYSQDNLVDAYSYDGTFLFSIMTRDAQNGGVSIWCTDHLLYLQPKLGDILVFNGTEFIESITYDELQIRGVRDSETNPVTVDFENVCSIDEEGNKHVLFSTPEEIKRNWPLFKFGTYDDRGYYGLMLAVFLSIWISFWIYHRKKSKSQKFPNLY
jgi:hypothetical protein